MLPVLIAGAGPSGLTLAVELARRGVDCRIVDKAPELFIGSRAKGLQPRTLEVFEDLGVLDAVFAGGAPFPAFRMYSGKEILWERPLHEMLGSPLPRRTPDVPYPMPWLIPQWRTDEILRDRFEELGGRVELSTELVDFGQDDDGVVATLRHDGRDEHVRAEFLVGTDGGRSFVRKHSGAGFLGTTWESERTLIGDVRAEGIDGFFCHMFTGGDLAKRFSLWNLPGSDHYQFVAAVDPDDEPELNLATVRKMLDERSGRTDIRLFDLRWISLYRINVRMVDRFRTGRVFLAGDAAHVHSSAAGQGLNTSVQDAYNLGWKLAAVLGGAPESLLDTYHEERFPVAADVLDLSTTLHHRGFRATLAPAGSSPAIHQLDITYRGSTLAVDDRDNPGHLRAGDRAPDALLDGGTRLFDVLKGPQWTLLVFGGASAGDLGPGVHVRSVSGVGGYEEFDGMFVLIRPDGHIGTVTSDADRVRAYLTDM
ncbi:3-(3-hydroxyphenyl)propionate hydroxylase [Actinosynnema sp. ALI-1.44]|uniref:FAD-dependent monooxygenase n=1 Tax=Actinosynnema sp. ALI-1.44 TaxID=1933779 RepID=UPI00097CB308|nr:FAD-dependent monooxygenase [Actinosynnema sp. ALI-1.44]ONI79504.1 3-(3-hydroxyphenyl)propionate hydroxylase [Actinosynnema sp. ALI-1.44]